MKSVRKIKKILKSKPTIEGAGVHLRRVFGYHQVPLFDPFLLMDDFHSDNPEEYLPGFPWHPHRGIETITYMLHGEVEHGDSMGNTGVIRSKDVQWMTAGSGIIHQEMPKGRNAGLMWGFQLWANLPASHKMMDPRYRDVKREQIPEVSAEGGVTVRIIAGEVNGTKGPVGDIVISPEYLDITIPPQTSFTHPGNAGHTVFSYVLEGAAYFDERRDSFADDVVESGCSEMEGECLIGQENIVLYDKGEKTVIETAEKPVRILFISGKPLGEPVAWYGPIVMNTQEELRTAFEEYRKGTFIKNR